MTLFPVQESNLRGTGRSGHVGMFFNVHVCMRSKSLTHGGNMVADGVEVQQMACIAHIIF
jgi:hypothetical protein